MKYIAAIIVALGFYWFFTSVMPKSEPVQVVAEPVRPRELSQVEKKYYVQIFDYTMDMVKPGESYSWQGHEGNGGIIKVAEIFKSKSAADCRPFSETFVVGGISGTAQGIACKRNGQEGWCRLKPTDALTCAMETNPYLIQVPGGSYSVEVPNANVDTSYSGPNVGGIGRVEAPRIEKGGRKGGAPILDDESGAGGSGKTGATYSDTVTGVAGGAAGPAVKNGKAWFKDTFR